MKRIIGLWCLLLLLPYVPAEASKVDEDREFFDGIQARMVGPFRGGRAMVAVGVAQNPHTYYMGTTGGVWKTTNAGASWQPVSDDDFGSSAVGAIAVAPSDPNVLYVGMGESPIRNIASSQGDGVYRSTDAGESWTHIGFDAVKQIGEIRVHPQDPNTVWVAAQGNTYLPGDHTGVAVSPAQPGLVWAIVEAEDDKGGLYRSTDGGDSWKQVNKSRLLRARSWYYMHIFADPQDPDTVYVMNAPFLKSIDGGKNFSDVSVPDGDNHYLWISPTDSQRMINATSRSINKGLALLHLDLDVALQD